MPKVENNDLYIIIFSLSQTTKILTGRNYESNVIRREQTGTLDKKTEEFVSYSGVEATHEAF